MTPRAVILAAGASRRMGRAKPCVLWRGRALVEHCVELAKAVGCDPIVVVQGAHPVPDDVLAGAARVDHRGWQAGPLSSLQAGVRAMMGGDEAHRPLVVLTVDRPHVAPATLRALVDASASDPRSVWQPMHAGRRGHPLVLPGQMLPDLLGLAATESLRSLLARPRWAACRRSLATGDGAVLDNIDTPSDLHRIEHARVP